METIGTSSLQASQQFTRPLPTALMTVSYLVAFYCLSHALKVIPVGIAYAIWSGLGIVLISTIGLVVFKQKLDGAGPRRSRADHRRRRGGERLLEVDDALVAPIVMSQTCLGMRRLSGAA